MERSTKQSWLAGAGDLREEDVENVPVPGQSVRIRALSATAANAANSEAVSTVEVRGQQRMKVDNTKLDIMRFQQGVIDPSFSVDEVKVISAKYGPAFQRVMNRINALSGIDQESQEQAEARFPGSGGDAPGNGSAGSASGDAGPAVPVRARGATGDDS